MKILSTLHDRLFTFDVPKILNMVDLLMNFYNGFYLTEETGNNAFSFSQRANRKIFVPPLIQGRIQDVAVGSEIAFSEIENGEEINRPGLKNFVHLTRGGQDIFIFDNHNHAFFFWMFALKTGRMRLGSRLVHVDQHKDTREPPQGFSIGPVAEIDLAEAFRYTNFVLNVGNFIRPAVAAKVFTQVDIIDSRPGFERTQHGEIVLDIDMDVFSQDMRYIEEDFKIRKIREWTSLAKVITVATSPYFMDQGEAVRLIKEIFTETS